MGRFVLRFPGLGAWKNPDTDREDRSPEPDKTDEHSAGMTDDAEALLLEPSGISGEKLSNMPMGQGILGCRADQDKE